MQMFKAAEYVEAANAEKRCETLPLRFNIVTP